MPTMLCPEPLLIGTVFRKIDPTDLQMFKSRADTVFVKGLHLWLTYIVKLYVWCDTEMQYFEQAHFTGPGGMINYYYYYYHTSYH